MASSDDTRQDDDPLRDRPQAEDENEAGRPAAANAQSEVLKSTLPTPLPLPDLSAETKTPAAAPYVGRWPPLPPRPPRLEGAPADKQRPPTLRREFELPPVNPPATDRPLTLVGGEWPADVSAPTHRRPWAAIVAVLVVGLAAAGTYWRLQPSQMPAMSGSSAVMAVATANLRKAQALFAHGVQLYSAKRYVEAIDAFERALKLDPNLADAHRSLGIVYATTHDQAKAVEHYQLYLQKVPSTPDTAAVRKIIADYAAAQGKEAALKAKPAQKKRLTPP